MKTDPIHLIRGHTVSSSKTEVVVFIHTEDHDFFSDLYFAGFVFQYFRLKYPDLVKIHFSDAAFDYYDQDNIRLITVK